METVACDLCGNTAYSLYMQSRDYVNKRAGMFSVVQCTRCGLIFTNPRPDKTEMLEFYPPSTPYYVYNSAGACPEKPVTGSYELLLQYFRGYFPEKSSHGIYKLLLYPLYVLKKQKLDREAIPLYLKNRKLLEIGCSYGKFLSEMRGLGWDVNGIEMSSHAVTVGKNIFGLDVIHNDIDEVELETDSYDVIIMRMFLEHAYSPSKVLKKVAQWLKPGGQLIVVVPDISGFEARLFGKYFYSLHLPNHLYHFSPETIRAYLHKYGLKISRITHHRTDRDFFKSIDNVMYDKKSLSSLRIMQRGFFKMSIRLFFMLMAALWKTSRMTVFATREG